MKIAVAMSGGVDSSTVAALLVEAGHEVIGLAMKTHATAPTGNRACCTPEDMRDARQMADKLDIPFYVLSYEDVFAQEIIAPFAAAYGRGETPNPCVACNDRVKFRPLLARAKLLGAEKLATGHYARLLETDRGLRLAEAKDTRKDQSYFLYRLTEEQLQLCLFPLGDMDKATVRAQAKRLGLVVHDKVESQEICFVGAEGYAKVVERLGQGGAPGNLVDAEGKVLGQHAGVHNYTIGQRRGLRLATPTPVFVTGIDAAKQEVYVGPRSALLTREVALADVCWTHGPPDPATRVTVRLRYRGTPYPARVAAAIGASARLELESPQEGGAPGQAAVVYDGLAVIGGGRITARAVARDPESRSFEARASS